MSRAAASTAQGPRFDVGSGERIRRGHVGVDVLPLPGGWCAR
jgi:hypothetical protein